MELLNPFTPSRILPVSRRDLLDNSIDFITVGHTDKSKITLDYAFKLPISGRVRTGVFTFLIEPPAHVMLEDEYEVIPPEITGVTFSAMLFGTDVRLRIVTNGVGENPVIYYRGTTIP